MDRVISVAGRPNKIKNSHHRKKIDEWIVEGKSDREIEALLKKQDPPEKIGKSSINTYRKNDFNINDEATKEYNEKKSQERLSGAVTKKVEELEALDDIIQKGSDLNLDIGSIMPDDDTGVTDLDIEKAKIQAKRLVIQAVKVKHDITKTENPNQFNFIVDGNVTVADVIQDPHDRAALTEIAARSRTGQAESSRPSDGDNS